jgi:methylenetetrahydrofolate dehydrogenase (NADP+)/methenyltetrahydrofolate cyclohydrolase
MLHLLMARHATVTVCHSHTKHLADITREADILVAAMGKAQFVKADMIKPGAVVIDVGINRIEPKKLVGDVDFDAAVEIASAITPVPGGVGLLTVAMLMKNVVTAVKLQIGA